MSTLHQEEYREELDELIKLLKKVGVAHDEDLIFVVQKDEDGGWYLLLTILGDSLAYWQKLLREVSLDARILLRFANESPIGSAMYTIGIHDVMERVNLSAIAIYESGLRLDYGMLKGLWKLSFALREHPVDRIRIGSSGKNYSLPF